MATNFSKTSRRYVDTFPLTGESLSDTGQPTLRVSVSHYTERKAYLAIISYVEIEQSTGYAIEKWQSDWPLLQVDSLPAARYSEKNLTAFRAEVLKRVSDADFTDPRILTLLDRIQEGQVAA